MYPDKWIHEICITAYLWHFKNEILGQAWWHTPLILALRMQRPADLWFQSQPGLNSKIYRPSRAI